MTESLRGKPRRRAARPAEPRRPAMDSASPTCHAFPMKLPALNVLGEAIQPCSTRPMTGFFRDGCCNTGPMDRGLHTVCAIMTAEFLALSKYLGNDLSTPRPEYGFPGLQPGDRWCLCASRFLQAHEEGAAPKLDLAATHQATLAIVPLDILRQYATD
jgi:uncharacterized protein